MADFHGYESDGMIFGMEVSLTSIPGKKFKKEVHKENVTGYFGTDFVGWVCEAPFVAALMHEAGWLVMEGHIVKFKIDGFLDDSEIYVKHGQKISFEPDRGVKI